MTTPRHRRPETLRPRRRQKQPRRRSRYRRRLSPLRRTLPCRLWARFRRRRLRPKMERASRHSSRIHQSFRPLRGPRTLLKPLLTLRLSLRLPRAPPPSRRSRTVLKRWSRTSRPPRLLPLRGPFLRGRWVCRVSRLPRLLPLRGPFLRGRWVCRVSRLPRLLPLRGRSLRGRWVCRVSRLPRLLPLRGPFLRGRWVCRVSRPLRLLPLRGRSLRGR